MSSKVSNQQILQKMEQGFKSIDGRLDRLEMSAADHDNKLAKMLTKDEFAIFCDGNATAHDLLAKGFEEFDQEFTVFVARQDLHQKALVEHHLLAA